MCIFERLGRGGVGGPRNVGVHVSPCFPLEVCATRVYPKRCDNASSILCVQSYIATVRVRACFQTIKSVE
jgi:hypothetical protein